MLVYLGFASLIVILFQANEMRKATIAMRDNTSIVLEGLRPAIAAKPHGDPTKDLIDPMGSRMRIALSNTGTTPAYGLVYESWIEILPFPFQDFTSSAEYHKAVDATVVYPDHSPLIINIPIAKGMTPQQREEVRHDRWHVCVRVRVEYKDFRRTKRYANFGFFVLHDGLGTLPKYNDAG